MKCRAVGERCIVSDGMVQLFIELLLRFYCHRWPVDRTVSLPSFERQPCQHQRRERKHLCRWHHVRLHRFVTIIFLFFCP